MKTFLLLLLLTNISEAKITGITGDCPFDARVSANEGEKFVTVQLNGENIKLKSVSDQVFSLQAKDPVTFRNNNLEFQMTSVVMSSLPRLVMNIGGIKKTCWVDLHGTNDKK